MSINRKNVAIAALVTACGLCATAYGQDSVGTVTGTYGAVKGDALASHEVSQQVVNYVVNLSPVASSWNNTFGIAPVVKSSQFTTPAGTDSFFSALTSAQYLSKTMRTNVAPRANTYATWTGAGPGVNAFRNSPAGTLNAPASVNQLALTFNEFGTPENSNVIGAFLNWSASQPGRLFVTRVNAATGTEFAGGPGYSTHGMGSVDSDGNVYFRADSSGMTGLASRLIGSDFVYRVRMGQRQSNTLNVIDITTTRLYQPWADNAGTTPFPGSPNLGNGNPLDDYDNDPTGIHDENATDAVSVPGTRTGTNPPAGAFSTNPPNNIPQQLAGRPVMLGSNFGMQYIYEATPNANPAATQAHRNANSPDHRGTVSFTSAQFFPNTVGTAGILTRINGNDTTNTRNIAIWGVNNSGAIVARTDATLTATVLDPFETDPEAGGTFGLGRSVNPADDYDGTADGVLWPAFYFDHYHSQTAFRGPTSPVALGRDLAGNALAAGTVYYIGRDDTQPANAIAVGRFNPQNPAGIQWTLAAWNNYPGVNGKSILDGSGNKIGELTSFEDLTTNNPRNIGRSANLRGPSMSSPAFDSAGNVYFISPIQIQRGSQLDIDTSAPPLLVSGQPNPERDLWEIGLLRAVYDQAAFGYRLELVLRTGQVIAGADSGLNYFIDTINIVDENSISSGSFASGNVTDVALNGQTLPANTPTSSTRTLGGLIVAVDLVYNVDGLDTTTQNDDRNFDGLPDDYPLEVGGAGPFEDASTGQGGSQQLFLGSQDQSYSAILFVGSLDAAPVCNCARNRGDANNDCVTNGADLSVLLSQFGSSVPANTGGDFNGDGVVNGADLSILLGNFNCQ